jgi:cobalt transporter subunit CbtA
MSLFRSIVFSAAVAGFVVGTAVTVVQQFGTVPLIQRAETYEHAAEGRLTAGTVAVHQHAGHDHGAAAWEPRAGLERNSFTAAANILTAIGFALVLSGIYALRGRPVTWHEGLLWGLGGFIVFTVAPGLGLPPGLPGTAAASLEARQIWWVATAAATAAGLGLLVFRRTAWAAILGLCLIASPHLIGAPKLPEVHADVSEALAHQFIVAVTLTSLLFWVLLGSLTSIAYGRFSAREQSGSAT